MKSSNPTISLLLLCLLVSESQGIRLEKGFKLQVIKNEIQKGENSLTKRLGNTDNGGKECAVAIICKDNEQFSGNNRKLTSVTPSTTSITRYKKKYKKAEPKSNGDKGNNVFAYDHQQYHQESSANEKYYPDDLVDIDEMDYSIASRKPPIHN